MGGQDTTPSQCRLAYGLLTGGQDATPFPILEWEIVRAARLGSWSCRTCWREWSCGSCCWSCCYWRSCWRERSCSWLHATCHTCYGIGIDVLNIPCTNVVEPTAIILMSINVERYHNLIATLNVELL